MKLFLITPTTRVENTMYSLLTPTFAEGEFLLNENAEASRQQRLRCRDVPYSARNESEVILGHTKVVN
jgi:hypothetical protein